MSFIEQSEQNVDRLMKEVSGGSVGGFVGGKGMGIDALFAGPYHPDSGYGSKNKQLLAKQLKDRKEKRKDIESSRDGVTKALWILFTGIAGIIVKILFLGN